MRTSDDILWIGTAEIGVMSLALALEEALETGVLDRDTYDTLMHDAAQITTALSGGHGILRATDTDTYQIVKLDQNEGLAQNG